MTIPEILLWRLAQTINMLLYMFCQLVFVLNVADVLPIMTFNKQNNQYVLYILWTCFRQAHSWNTAQCDDFTKTIRYMRSVNQHFLVGDITEILPTWPINTKKLTINLLLYMFCKLAFIISIANILSILTFRKNNQSAVYVL